MSETKKLKAIIPFFPGFYGSILDGFIDQEVDIVGEEDENVWEEMDEMEDRLDYTAARIAISKEWVKVFGKEIGINLEFVELWSPREYNYMTDKVYVDISEEDIMKIHDTVHPANGWVKPFQDVINDWFTPRSGFIPHYSNDLSDWEYKKMEDLDEIELSVYLAAYALLQCDEEELLDSIHGTSSVYEAAQAVWKC